MGVTTSSRAVLHHTDANLCTIMNTTVVVYCSVNCYSQPNCINQPFFKKGKKYANNFTLMVKAANFS